MIAIGIKGAATSHFTNHGRSICIETFPDTQEFRPSVILLHGANGTRYGNPIVSGVMQYLGVNGFIAHLVHYFDRTNTSYADDYTIRENFSAWLETVADGVSVVRERFPDRPLGLFGHSLGGFLSAATLIRNPAVNAAVILSGGVDAESALRVERTAPVLIMHGTNDTRVPITEALARGRAYGRGRASGGPLVSWGGTHARDGELRRCARPRNEVLAADARRLKRAHHLQQFLQALIRLGRAQARELAA